MNECCKQKKAGILGTTSIYTTFTTKTGAILRELCFPGKSLRDSPRPSVPGYVLAHDHVIPTTLMWPGNLKSLSSPHLLCPAPATRLLEPSGAGSRVSLRGTHPSKASEGSEYTVPFTITILRQCILRAHYSIFRFEQCKCLIGAHFVAY